MLIHVFAVGLLLAATGGRLDMRQYRNNRGTGNNPIQKEQVVLQKQALALQEESLRLQKRNEQRQRNNDRERWEVQTQDRDKMLTDQALGLNDGKCADYFCGVRCRLPATNNGFCAKHYRELQKNEKELKYKRRSSSRF